MGTSGIIHLYHECSEFTPFFSNSIIEWKIGVKMAYGNLAYCYHLTLNSILRIYPVFLEFTYKMEKRGKDGIWKLSVLLSLAE